MNIWIMVSDYKALEVSFIKETSETLLDKIDSRNKISNLLSAVISSNNLVITNHINN